MSQFSIDLTDGVDLVLREAWTVDPLHALIVKNLDRLRAWEPWAQGEQTRAGLAEFTTHELMQWVQGRGIPAAIRRDGVLVGSIGARIDPYASIAELGYWIDVDVEGQGLVTRAGAALVEHLRAERRIRRLEIRAAVDNAASLAVAERLGFVPEGVLRQAQAVGDVVHDMALYSLV